MILKLENTNFTNKSLFSTYNIDDNKIVVSNKVPFVKRISNILMAIKMLNKLDLYAYSFQQ